MRVRNVLLPILLIAVGWVALATAQNRGTFVVDGDPMDWSGDYALRNEVILPTAVEPDTWGRVKSR